jgi:hypothetical protein
MMYRTFVLRGCDREIAIAICEAAFAGLPSEERLATSTARRVRIMAAFYVRALRLRRYVPTGDPVSVREPRRS